MIILQIIIFDILYTMPPKRNYKKRAPARRSKGTTASSTRPGQFTGYARKGHVVRRKSFNSRLKSMVTFSGMKYKAHRSFDDFSLSMIGPFPAGNSRVVAWSLWDNPLGATRASGVPVGIPKFDPTSLTTPQADFEQCRQSDRIFVKRVNFSLAMRSTHDRQLTCRLIVLKPTAGDKNPGITWVPGGYPDTQNNFGVQSLFEDYVVKTPIGTGAFNVNSVNLSLAKINPRLISKSSDILVDKTMEVTPYAAGDASSDTFGKYTFNLPINQWVDYNDLSNNAASQSKASSLNVILVFGSADPAAATLGAVTGRVHCAVSFME